MKEKLETIRELIIRKKAFVLLTFLLVFTISGSLIYVSSAKEKASIEVSSLQTRMQDKLNEIDSLKDTISLQDEELSSLKLENQNIQASLDDYIRKDNQQKELSSTVKKQEQKTVLLSFVIKA